MHGEGSGEAAGVVLAPGSNGPDELGASHSRPLIRGVAAERTSTRPERAIEASNPPHQQDPPRPHTPLSVNLRGPPILRGKCASSP